MSEDLIIRHCSPTLAGIKTGNIFSCPCPCREELLKDLSRLNRMLSSKGVRVLPLRICGGRALIYLYRPGSLKSDFENGTARELLVKYGYAPEKPSACISRLIHRLRTREEAIRRRTSSGLSTAAAAVTNAPAAGRCTEISRKRSRPSKDTTSARKAT